MATPMMLNKFDLNATYTWVMTTTMTSGKEYFFGDITKKAFGNSTQKLYFIRNNSFLPLIHTSRLKLLINYCHLQYMTQ